MSSIENALQEYGGVDMIFNPIPSYDGMWEFKTVNLSKNSLKKDGKNLFEEFFTRTFKKPIVDIFGTSQISIMSIKMVSMPNDNNIGRSLRYSKVAFFTAFLAFLNQEVDKVGKTPEEHDAHLRDLFSYVNKDNTTLNSLFAQEVEKKAAIYEDVFENGQSSIYYDALVRDYHLAEAKCSIREFTRINARQFHLLAKGLLNLGDFFDRDLDINELYSCFDPDTFYLLFAKIVYEYNLKNYANGNGLNNNYGILMNYKEACKTIGNKYNPKIQFILDSGRITKVSRWQLDLDTEELMAHYPEAKPIMLPDIGDAESTKYRDISLINKLMSLYDEDAKVSWEFLPKGEKIVRVTDAMPRKKGGNIKTHVDNSILIEEVNKRISFLEHSEFIGTPIRGLNTFTGYYAFVYPNGKVVLEKFWENEEKMTPAIRCATYVMSIDNFVEMSKNSKTLLIEYIKLLPDIGVKRIFHTSFEGWQKALLSQIQGSYRLEDAIEFINSLKTGARSNE